MTDPQLPDVTPLEQARSLLQQYGWTPDKMLPYTTAISLVQVTIEQFQSVIDAQSEWRKEAEQCLFRAGEFAGTLSKELAEAKAESERLKGLLSPAQGAIETFRKEFTKPQQQAGCKCELNGKPVCAHYKPHISNIWESGYCQQSGCGHPKACHTKGASHE